MNTLNKEKLTRQRNRHRARLGLIEVLKPVAASKTTKLCEFCKKHMEPREREGTVCGTCDAKLEAKFAHEDQLKAAQHAKRYKCQSCNVGLPLSRRIKCEDCHTQESEDVYFDGFDSVYFGVND